MTLDNEIRSELISKGVDFVHFVDVSKLSSKENKHYPTAVLFGILLSPVFIQKVNNTPNYVQSLKQNNQLEDEFSLTEKKTDRLADQLANFITTKGFSAYSQSEENIINTGFFNEKIKTSPLPNKTIAGLAGIGWIGKNNLLVSPEYGCAFSMCAVLTDAPVQTILKDPQESQCGDCDLCRSICTVDAIEGRDWNKKSVRDDLIDVFKCNTCFMCLAICPYTQRYMKKNLL